MTRHDLVGIICFSAVSWATLCHIAFADVVSPRTIVRIEPFRFDVVSTFDGTMSTLEHHCYSVTKEYLGENVGAVSQKDIIEALTAQSGSLLLYDSHGDVGVIWGETFNSEQAAIARKEWLVEWLFLDEDDLMIGRKGQSSVWTIGLTNSFTDNACSNRDVAVIATCYGSTTGDFNAACKLGGIDLCGDDDLAQDWQCLVGRMQFSAWRTFDLAKMQCGSINFAVDSGQWQLFTALDGAAPDCEHTWGWVKSQFHGQLLSSPVTEAYSNDVTTLVWSHPEEGPSDSYLVFKWTGGDPDDAIAIDTVATGDSTFVDESVEAGVEYSYRIAGAEGETLLDLGIARAGLHRVWESVGDAGTGSIVDMAIYGNSLFVVRSEQTVPQMFKYDVTNPEAPVEVARRTSFPGNVSGFTIDDDGTRLFVTTNTGLLILDATTTGGIPTIGALSGLASGSNWVADPVYDDHVVYVACMGEGLKAVYVPSGGGAVVKGSYIPGEWVQQVTMRAGLLYLDVEGNTTVVRPVKTSLPWGSFSVTFEVVGGTGSGDWSTTLRNIYPSRGKTGRFALGSLRPDGGPESELWIVDLIDPLRPELVRRIEPPIEWLGSADFDQRYFYGGVYSIDPYYNDPFDRSVGAYEIDGDASLAQYTLGDTLGQSKEVLVASHGDYLVVLDDFWPKGYPQYDHARLRVFSKAHGCAPDPDLPLRLIPESDAYKVGQEIGISWRVGCPVGIVVDLMQGTSVAVAGTVSHAYGTMTDFEGCARVAIPSLGGIIENYSYRFRATVSYEDNTQSVFYSLPFRLEIGNTLEVASDGSKPYTSIQAAINASSSGDTILVRPGSYGEHLTLRSNVRVIANQGASLTPTSSGPAITVAGVVHPPTVAGLFVQFTPGLNETGIRVTDCGIQVQGCTFNSLTRAVEINNGYGAFDRCTFTNNYEPLGGGAAWIAPASAGPATMFTDCVFTDNSAGSRGGAVYIGGAGAYDPAVPQASFLRCRFSGNTAPEAAAVRVGINRRPVFEECVFAENVSSSTNAGSIVGGLSDAGAVFTNCTFADNTGSAAYSVMDFEPLPITSPVVVDACIVANNVSASAFSPAFGAAYEATRTDFYGNASGDAGFASQGVDCFSADPAFCGAGAYTLYSSSPCIGGVATGRLVGALGVGCSPPAVVELLGGLGGIAPDSLLFGCPAGDADSFVVRIDFDDSIVTRELAAGEIALTAPYSEGGIWSPSPIVAGGPAAGPDHVTTLRHRFVSGTGADSLEVQLNGYPLARRPVLQRRGPDLDGDGDVDVQDFAIFGLDYQSPPKPYDPRSDFNGDSTVTVNDYSLFGTHVNHKRPFTTVPLAATALPLSAANIGLRFEESDPLQGEHKLRAYVTVENTELFRAMLIALESENPVFEFIEWHPNPGYPQVTMGAETEWNGKSVVMIGALGNKNNMASFVELGYFDVLVHADTPVEPAVSDFRLLTGDVLAVGGSVLNVPASSTRRTYSAPNYRNTLGQNYPNPFNPATTIAFSLERRTRATLIVYDVRGSRVRTLVDEDREIGNHRVSWNGDNDRGNRVASGVYFYRLTAGTFQSAKKMVLLR